MYDIEVDGTSYPLKFGMAFLRSMDNRVLAPIEGSAGQTKGIGFRQAVVDLIDSRPDTLVEVIYTANKTEKPKMNKHDLEAYLEDDDTDIDALFEQVLDFLEGSNVTRRATTEVRTLVAQALKESGLTV